MGYSVRVCAVVQRLEKHGVKSVKHVQDKGLKPLKSYAQEKVFLIAETSMNALNFLVCVRMEDAKILWVDTPVNVIRDTTLMTLESNA